MKKNLIKTITKGIQEKKGRNIAIIDLRKIEGAVCNHFIICEGGSPAQIEAIAESVGDMARAEGEKPTNVIGLNNCQWVAMDYVDVIVHIFLPDMRQYYDIEHLWEDARIKRIKDED